MRLPVLCGLCCALALLLSTGCQDREVIKSGVEAAADKEAKAIAKDIAALKAGAKPEDPELSAAYGETIQRLTQRGSAIESSLIDALRADPDPAVRIGVIEVMQSVGTKASIDHLIAVLDDPVPLVSWHAEITLRVLLKTRQIPEAGKPANGDLPPIPARAASDVALDAEERIWAAWHAEHRVALKAAWERWWAGNRANVKLD
jgi:hypothetical protein